MLEATEAASGAARIPVSLAIRRVMSISFAGVCYAKLEEVASAG